MCKVSIIVPSYNVISYIRECMDSLVGQTLEDIEILCVDGDSDDGTREVLEEYAKKDFRVRILEDEKHSTGYAKNTGVEHAKGQYIGIVESDDYVARDMFEQLYNCAIQQETDLVKANYKAFTGDGDERIYALKAVSLNRGDYNRLINLRESSRYFNWDMYTWTGIYKKSFLEEFQILHHETPGAAFQDVGFWLQVFAHARTAYLIPEYLYHYRRDNPYSSVHQSNKIYEMPGEYRFGLNRIEKRGKLNNRILKGIYRGMYSSYEFIYGLLESGYRGEFAGIFYEDMKNGFEKNAVVRELYTEEEWKGILAIKESADAYETYRYQTEAEKEKNQKALFRAVDGWKKNVIFGAGSDGTNLQVYLKSWGRNRTEAFCDNGKEKRGMLLNGVRVVGPEELREKTDRLILVASKLYGREIKEQLLRMEIEEERIYLCDVGGTIPSYL